MKNNINQQKIFAGIEESRPDPSSKSKDPFFKETKGFISNNEMRTYLNVEIWI